MSYMRLATSLVIACSLALAGCLSEVQSSEPGSIEQISGFPEGESSAGKADNGIDDLGRAESTEDWGQETKEDGGAAAEASLPDPTGDRSGDGENGGVPCGAATCSEVWLASPPGTFADAVCAAAVCALDGFCCDGNWDEACTDCADGGEGFAGTCAGQISPEQCSCQASPCDAEVGGDGSNAEPIEPTSEPGTEPESSRVAEDDGGDPDEGDGDRDDPSLWDWGDGSTCPDCDAAAFEGVYDMELIFQGSDSDAPVCKAMFEATLTEDGALQYETKCSSTTGLSFVFGFDLYTHFNCSQASAETGCLAGTATLELPSGDVLETTLFETEYGGYVTTAVGPWVYWSLYASYLVTIETPSGPREYGVYATAPPGQ